MEQAADGTREIHARETSEDGIHSIVVKLPKSNTNSVVSARVNIKAENCESCHVNLRSSANLSNSILTHVDMVGRVGAFMGTGNGQRVANATTRTLANGWIEVQIEGLLFPDGAFAKIEISTGM